MSFVRKMGNFDEFFITSTDSSPYHSGTVSDIAAVCERATVRLRSICYAIVGLQWSFSDDKSSKFTRSGAELCGNRIRVSETDDTDDGRTVD